jgi:hypothetical protein
MAIDRRPIFELHIRPMFRLLDDVHMLRLPLAKRVDLSSYDDVKAKHVAIRDFLKSPSPMPTKKTGGPWPQEWIDLFDRWIATGFGKLSRPTATDARLKLMAPDRYLLECDVVLPDAGAMAWFEIMSPVDAQIYAIVCETPANASGASAPATITEQVRGPLSVAQVTVIDGSGPRPVAVPTA